jgi:hypothetical protein
MISPALILERERGTRHMTMALGVKLTRPFVHNPAASFQ